MSVRLPKPSLGFTRRRSLQRRIIGLLLLVGLLPLLIAALGYNLQSTQTLTNHANTQLSELASSSMEKLDRDLFDRLGNVQAFATSDAARSMDPLRITPLMARMTAIYAPFYRLMIVVDAQGRIVAASSARADGTYLDGVSLLGQSVRGEAWFEAWASRDLRAGSVYVEDVHIDLRVAGLYGDEGFVMSFSHGIFDQAGTLTGVWINIVDWRAIQAILEEAETRAQIAGATTTALTLVNRDNLVLSSSEDIEPLSRSYLPPSNVFVQRAASTGYAGRSLELGWSVIATQERSEALLLARRLTIQTLLLAAALGASVMGLGLIAARLILNPIKSMQRAAERISAGNLNVQVPEDDDEIGQLGRAFNSMTSQLRDVYSTLEASVIQRTGELEQTLSDLRRRSAELQESQEQLSATNATLAESEARYRKLFEQAAATLNETQVLYRTVGSLIGSDLDVVLQTVVDGAVEALHANAVSLITFDIDAEIVTNFVRGGPGRERVEEVPFDELWQGLCGWVLRHEQPALSPGNQADPRESYLAQVRRRSMGNGSVLVVPLRYRERIFGVMTAINTLGQRDFDEHDVEILTTLANQAALAMENSHLYAAAQQELAERRRIEEELRAHKDHLEVLVSRRTAELAQVAAELGETNEHLRAGVELARDIQLGLLPDRPPWDMATMAVAGTSLAAAEVGGDFYAYLETDHSGGMITIGDISGKGVGAALVMALTTSALETEVRSENDPGRLLSMLNQQLFQRLRINRMNAAALVMDIDCDSRRLAIANAGMIAPLLVRGGDVSYIEAYGLPMGSLPSLEYSTAEVALEPQDLIILISDGVVEAHNEDSEIYGFERLEAIVATCARINSVEEIVGTIIGDVVAFSSAVEQHDDITVVAVRPRFKALG